MADLEILVSTEEAQENLENLNKKLEKAENSLLRLHEKKELFVSIDANLEEDSVEKLKKEIANIKELKADVELSISQESEQNLKKAVDTIGKENPINISLNVDTADIDKKLSEIKTRRTQAGLDAKDKKSDSTVQFEKANSLQKQFEKMQRMYEKMDAISRQFEMEERVLKFSADLNE